ncbi:MAG: glycosyltransferase, partial [Deltaproteobacteria bacterium]|nr:glycosyltransferase [Deltaproteobacteria bacterium]
MSSGQGVRIQGAVAANRIDELEQLLGVPACRALGIYRVPDDFVLSVVIPVYNEVDTVVQVIEQVRSIPLKLEIIVIDDGST